MADDKNGRENQAQNEDRRQRERAIAAELERGDEPEPETDDPDVADVEKALESVSFPATAAEIVETLGDREVVAPTDTYTVADLLPQSDVERFETPDSVTERVKRPTVASAMKRVVEAQEPLQNESLRGSQRDAYERTFKELEAIDEVDDDEGIRMIADWIVQRIEERNELPGSRDVRRQAAKVCRASGYEVRNDEWLGV